MDENIKIIAEENFTDWSKKSYTKTEMLNILDKVGKGVAKHAMDSIVANVEHGKPDYRDLWSIRDAYETKDQMKMLPTNRTTPEFIKERFHNACRNGDTQELKECFELGARIYSGGDDALIRACNSGLPATIEFFLLDKETKYQAIDLKTRAAECFEAASVFENIPVLEYFIAVHHLDKNPAVQDSMRQTWFQNSIVKETVENLINSINLNAKLETNLDSNKTITRKPKI